mmetsp:Transcript_62367/g.69804  ORF Transcript_62367/g.69804 Transcript_62367/m.69804 type:complete len:189 (+) Transcript_62367:111-677(+)
MVNNNNNNNISDDNESSHLLLFMKEKEKEEKGNDRNGDNYYMMRALSFPVLLVLVLLVMAVATSFFNGNSIGSSNGNLLSSSSSSSSSLSMVPSSADMKTFGIQYCGLVTGPDGRDVTVEDAVRESNFNRVNNKKQSVYHMAGFSNDSGSVRTPWFHGNTLVAGKYLWGRSCQGTCHKDKKSISSCTY